jgi:hypothetical protein
MGRSSWKSHADKALRDSGVWLLIGGIYFMVTVTNTNLFIIIFFSQKRSNNEIMYHIPVMELCIIESNTSQQISNTHL